MEMEFVYSPRPRENESRIECARTCKHRKQRDSTAGGGAFLPFSCVAVIVEGQQYWE